MPVIKDIFDIYHGKIDYLDLELLIASAINKPREFVLAHPEYPINSLKIKNLKLKIARRAKGEPIAYILGRKEFYGLNFKVDKNTLIPRPETELLMEKVMELDPKNAAIIDVGTGSGNIIISLAKFLKKKNRFVAIDISRAVLSIAKQNAKIHKVECKIKFINGNLLEPIIGNWKLEIGNSRILILANLPYLSIDIYASASPDIKKYEPRGALVSDNGGLSHYEKLLKQIRILKHRNSLLPVSCFLEMSPEQKRALHKLIMRFFPKTKPAFYKDLSGRWRVCQIDLP